jgi:hypothetical protein
MKFGLSRGGAYLRIVGVYLLALVGAVAVVVGTEAERWKEIFAARRHRYGRRVSGECNPAEFECVRRVSERRSGRFSLDV